MRPKRKLFSLRSGPSLRPSAHPACVRCSTLRAASNHDIPQSGVETLRVGARRARRCHSGCSRHAFTTCVSLVHPGRMQKMPRISYHMHFGADSHGSRCTFPANHSRSAGLSGCFAWMWHTVPAMLGGACVHDSHFLYYGAFLRAALVSGRPVVCVFRFRPCRGVRRMFEMLCPHAPRQLGRCHRSCHSRGIPPSPGPARLSKARGETCLRTKSSIACCPAGEQGAVEDMRRGNLVPHACSVGSQVTVCRTMA